MNARFIHVNDAQERPFAPELQERIERAVSAALDRGAPDGESRDAAEVSITLLGDDDIRELNRRFHSVDAATDVLTFGLGDAHDPGSASTADPAVALLGDLYVGVDVASASAAEHGEELEDEIVRLAVHGTLHLLGHDHPEGEDRYESEMFRVQEQLLAETR